MHHILFARRTHTLMLVHMQLSWYEQWSITDNALIGPFGVDACPGWKNIKTQGAQQITPRRPFLFSLTYTHSVNIHCYVNVFNSLECFFSLSSSYAGVSSYICMKSSHFCSCDNICVCSYITNIISKRRHQNLLCFHVCSFFQQHDKLTSLNFILICDLCCDLNQMHKVIPFVVCFLIICSVHQKLFKWSN